MPYSPATPTVTLPGTEQWTNGCSNGSGTHVMLSGNTGRIAYSLDNGATWDAATVVPGNLPNWAAVVWSGTYFYAISAAQPAARVARSPNGINWTVLTTDIPSASFYNTRSMIWTGTHLVAMADNPNYALKSADGMVWTRTTPTGYGYAGQLAVGNGMIVMSGDSGSVMASPDGQVWTKYLTPGFGGGAQAPVAFFNGKFYLFGQSGYNLQATSPDGFTWTAEPTFASEGNFNTLASNGTRLVNVGRHLWTSDNLGKSWIDRGMGLGGNSEYYGGVFGADGYYVAAYPNIYTSPTGVTWTQRLSGFNFNNNTPLFAKNGAGITVIASSGNSVPTVFTSSNGGVNWTQTAVGGSSNNSLVWDGTRFVLLQATGSVLYSTDGVAWAMSPAGLGASSAFGLVSNGAVLVAGSWLTGSPQRQQFHRSHDHGVTWDVDATPNTYGSYPDQIGPPFTIGATIFYTRTNAQPNGLPPSFLRSTDNGVTFTPVPTDLPLVSPYLQTYLSAQKVKIGATIYALSNNGKLWASTNGINWVGTDGWPYLGVLNSAVVVDGRLVVTGRGCILASTADGTTWDQTILSPDEYKAYATGGPYVGVTDTEFGVAGGSPTGVRMMTYAQPWTSFWTGFINCSESEP